MTAELQKTKSKFSFTHAGAFWTGFTIGTFTTVVTLWLFMRLMLSSAAIP
jgi:hypothetical protein